MPLIAVDICRKYPENTWLYLAEEMLQIIYRNIKKLHQEPEKLHPGRDITQSSQSNVHFKIKLYQSISVKDSYVL